jgi:hypothetical protein
MKLDVKACALTGGLIWGLGLFVLTWWVIAFDGLTGEATLIGCVYRGYSITPIGSMIGMVWGLFDGLIGVAILRGCTTGCCPISNERRSSSCIRLRTDAGHDRYREDPKKTRLHDRRRTTDPRVVEPRGRLM